MLARDIGYRSGPPRFEAIRATARRAACLHPFIVVRDGLFPSHGLLLKSVLS
jgi:hypothetical protein